MSVEGIQGSTHVEEEMASRLTVPSLGATVARGGVVCAMPRLRIATGDQSSDVVGAPERHGAVMRKVGIEYSVQVLLNSLPLLIVDILTLTATIVVCRTAFFQFGFSVGINVSACLLPMATGFVLISTELGLYPGVRHSPVEEFRRLIVSVTAVFAMWAVAGAVLTGGLTLQRWFLLVVYLCCLV